MARVTQTMTISVDPKTLKQIIDYCQANGGISRSAAVRQAVQYFFARSGKQR